jgi:hypothetical protein
LKEKKDNIEKNKHQKQLQPSESRDKNIIKSSNFKPLVKGLDACNSKFTLNEKNSLQVLGEKQGGVDILFFKY